MAAYSCVNWGADNQLGEVERLQVHIWSTEFHLMG